MRILKTGIEVPVDVQNFYRFELNNLESINIQRSDDIVLTDGNVPVHKDGTIAGKNTVMLVLINDADLRFLYGRSNHKIPVGTIFRFDGNIDHTLVDRTGNIGTGRYVGIIWDVPINMSDKLLIKDLITRLQEL